MIVELCGEPHKLEIDTGATRTVLNEETYNKLRDKLELKSSKAALSTYTEEKKTSVGLSTDSCQVPESTS